MEELLIKYTQRLREVKEYIAMLERAYELPSDATIREHDLLCEIAKDLTAAVDVDGLLNEPVGTV